MSRNIKRPYFTIVIPTYNRANHIQETLKSVLNQDFSDFEVIVVDDGSLDNTEEVVKVIGDDRLHYFKKKNEERGAARNYGILRSSGAYVTFLDSDDRLYPNHLSIAREFIKNNNQPEFFHSDYEIKDSKGRLLHLVKIGKENANRKLAKGNFLSCIGVFVRLDVIRENLFNENRRLAGSEDWELWMRLASRYSLLSSRKVTAFMVQHEGRSVMELNEKKVEKRISLAWQSLRKDEMVCKVYHNQMLEIEANLNLYLALHLMRSGSKKRAFNFIYKAIQKDLRVLFTRKMVVLFYKGLM